MKKHAFLTSGRQTAAQTAPALCMHVWGQEHTKRALEVACAGAHNLLMLEMSLLAQVHMRAVQLDTKRG